MNETTRVLFNKILSSKYISVLLICIKIGSISFNPQMGLSKGHVLILFFFIMFPIDNIISRK